MNKYAFLSVFAMGMVIASCKEKCHECHYDLNGAEIEIGEYCGDELEAIEASGYVAADTITYEVHCHEH
ncbi:MAG: hypothetical protein ACKOZM_10945 [Flavobacteriales bacterium]